MLVAGEDTDGVDFNDPLPVRKLRIPSVLKWPNDAGKVAVTMVSKFRQV